MPRRSKHIRILDIERSLGFRWENGICRSRGKSFSVPEMKDLLADIDGLKEDFVHVCPGDLRSDDELIRRSKDLFSKYGPLLWPRFTVDTRGWLVQAAENDWDGLYPEDLSYFNPFHRTKLQQHFLRLVVEKCVRYHGNQRQKWYREESLKGFASEQSESTSDVLSDASSPQLDVTSNWEGAEVAGPSSTQASKPIRPQRKKSAGFGTPTGRRSTVFKAPIARMLPRETSTQRDLRSSSFLSSMHETPARRDGLLETSSNTGLASGHHTNSDTEVRATASDTNGSLGIQEKNVTAVRKVSRGLEAEDDAPSKRAKLSTPARALAAPDLPAGRSQIKPELAENDSIGNEPLTALERARAAVYWHSDTDCPTYIPLRNLKTHGDLFDQLHQRRPLEFHYRSIVAVEVRITNAEDSGVTENPNCRIEAKPDYGEEPFDVLVDTLSSQGAAQVRPKLKLTVESSD